MNYWLHRISHIAELSYPLLEKGYLTIGFSDFTDKDIIDITLRDDWETFEQVFLDVWNTKPRIRHNLWRFLKFKKGDKIIVPSWGTFYVCEIVDDNPLLIGDTHSKDLTAWGDKKVTKSKDGKYLLKEDGTRYDLGFARKMKILHEKISREKYADGKLTSRLKIRQTNADINDLKDSIQKGIRLFEKGTPINLHSTILDKTSQLTLNVISDELYSDKFEKLIELYFKKVGADSVHTPAKNESNKEGDADIVATFESLKLIIYVQAKHHEGITNDWAVNQVLDYKNSKEDTKGDYNTVSWVISTANDFNDNAKELAQESDIQLINGLEFSKMLLNAGISSLSDNL